MGFVVVGGFLVLNVVSLLLYDTRHRGTVGAYGWPASVVFYPLADGIVGYVLIQPLKPDLASVTDRVRDWIDQHLFFKRALLCYVSKHFGGGEISVRSVATQAGRARHPSGGNHPAFRAYSGRKSCT
jgi:hypothetical protein